MKLWRYLKSQKQDNDGIATLKSDGMLAVDAPGKAGFLNNWHLIIALYLSQPYPVKPWITLWSATSTTIWTNVTSRLASNMASEPTDHVRHNSSSLHKTFPLFSIDIGK